MSEDEIASLAQEMEQVLEYASSLSQVAQASDLSMLRVAPSNTFRSDIAETWDTDAILDQAPHEEDRYYVVPKVLSQKQG